MSTQKKIALMYNQNDCNGCHACEVACKLEHGLGEGPRIVRVIETSPLFVPLFCHHCEDSPCAIACPEDAISRDPETGVVLIDPEKCNGCNAVEGKSGAEKNQTSACKVECPVKNDVQGFVSLTARGKYEEAIKLIKQTSPFPSVCGRVCPHPCELKCNRDQIDDPVSIQSIERFLADRDRTSGKPYMPEVKEVKEEKIAIIGSGPAGLSAAYALIKEGYKVTVFEKLPVAGGMMAVGIPEYRLPGDIVHSEIKMIQDMGVTIKTGVTFGKDITLSSLKKDGYKAVFLATGLHQTQLKADKVILATGQAVDLSFAEKQGISVSPDGSIEADPVTLETSVKGVFAGGDVFYGPKTVARAIASGKEAALSIDRYVKGLDLRAGRLLRDNPVITITEPLKENYDPAARVQIPVLDKKERVKGLVEFRQGLTKDAAVQEAKRCISCGACCVQACPYGVMQFNHEVTKAVKCDLCIERRENNEVPACSLACPAHCIYWGDPAAFPIGIYKYIQKSV
jgi:NADPH-dependent glutamate synthase beta subunit-like oxidoreductase